MNISDRSLSEACAILRDQRLDTLPTEEEHVFSDVFERKMKQLFSRAKKKFFVYKAMQTAAVIFLSIAITGSTVVAVNASARERVRNWLKSRISNWILYETDDGVKIFTNAEIIFEGLYLVDTLADNSDEKAFLISKDDKTCMLICRLSNTSFAIQMEEFEYYPCMVNNSNADYYKVLNHDGTNELLWTDESSGIILNITGKLEMDDMVSIAETIRVIITE